MTDNDLKKIAQTPTPKPRRHAREAAVTAAMAEFDAVQSEEYSATAQTTQTKRRDFKSGSKGLTRRARLSSNQTLLERKFSMRSLSKYAVAASVVAVAIVGPASLYFLSEHERETTAGGLGGVMDLQSSSGSQPRLDRAEGRQVEPKRVAADKPQALPAPAPTSTAKDEKVATITPPATGRLKNLGEFYDYRASSKGPSDGLGAVGGGQGWSFSMGGGQGKVAQQEVSGMRKEREQRPVMGALNTPALDRTATSTHRYAKGLDSQIAGGFSGLGGPDDRDHLTADPSRDKFETAAPNPIKQVATDPVSTFSLDVDTASYAFVRRALNAGRLPPRNAVRVEELVNYFNYDYAPPESAEAPFKVLVNVVPSPWSAANKLVHLSVKGYELSNTERPHANLVFLVDVSGSMTSQDKLPLVKNALRMLVNELKPDDTIGIVTYASGTAIALEPTKVANKHKVLSVIGGLRSGGSTAGARGIQDAYRLAESHFNPEGVNRIILATDGDFNVGITNREDLKGYIARKRKSGVYLSILGVGRGNYNDALMQTLAQNGNGTASYIDTLNEARKVLVDEASSTLFTIAKDVKVQVEFNPERVQSYRLIGYETRALKREDFNNDRVDAGDVGSGHSVTAIYEITPVGAPAPVDKLRYGTPKSDEVRPTDPDGEFGFVKLRYKLPNETTSKLISQAITPEQEKSRLDLAPQDTRFSIAVAGFGQLLRDNPALEDFSYDDVIELARRAKGEDRFGYRSEFINLVRNAKAAQP